MQALHALDLLDTAAEERFDRLTELAAMTLDVPVALISLVDEDRQWFKSRYGLDATETPRDVAFCSHAIVADTDGAAFVVDDALADPRFSDNPLVTGDPHVRFYAGQVLLSPDGMPVGTLCAIDHEPRTLTDRQHRALGHLAALVEAEMHGREHARRSIAVASSEQSKSLILDAVNAGMVLQSAAGELLEWNSAAERLLGLSHDELGERTAVDTRFVLTHEDGSPLSIDDRPSSTAFRTGQPISGLICGLERPRSERIWLNISAHLVTNEFGELQAVTTFTDVTAEVDERRERLRLEKQVRRQAHLAQASLDALDQGVLLADNAGCISVANAAAEHILGYTAAEITTLWQAFEWQSFDQQGDPLDYDERPTVRAMQSGNSVNGELIQWRHKSGHLVLLRITCVPDPENDAVVVAFTDVTEEQYARRLLDVTLEMAPAGLAMLDSDGAITRCNPAFAEHVDRFTGDLVGVSAFDLIHPDDRPLAENDRDQLLAGSSDLTSLDHRVLRPDGAERWVHTQIAVIRTSSGPIALASTFDITERRQLLRDVSRFRYLVEQSNDLISVINPDGTVQYSSPAMQRTFGDWSRHSNGGDVYSSIHPDDISVATAAIVQMMASETPIDPFTVRSTTDDDAWLHIEFAGINLLDEPAVCGLVLTGRDVTQRVALTDQLQHQASHDTLTDLANRTVVHDELERCLARRSDTRVGLCFIDLDSFKSVNDELGHAAGDRVLSRVAECLRVNLRPGDTAARVGGDEFVVILDPVDSHADAVQCAERLRDALVSLADTVDGPDGLGASVGVVIDHPGDTASSFLNRADAAMYRAKARGGSAVASDRSPDSC